MAVREVDYCSAASLLIRKSTWETVGGISEEYFPAYYEDVDLAFSIAAAGENILYQPRSVVFHDESVSTERDYRLFLLYRNRASFAGKWRERLAHHEERVQKHLGASVHRAVLRSQGYPRQVLVCGTMTELEGASEQIGALAESGYGTAIAITDGQPRSQHGPGSLATTSRQGRAELLTSHLGQMGVETVALGTEGLATHLLRPEILYTAILLFPSQLQERASLGAVQPMATILPIESPQDWTTGKAGQLRETEASSARNKTATIRAKAAQRGYLVAMLDIAMATTRKRYA